MPKVTQPMRKHSSSCFLRELPKVCCTFFAALAVRTMVVQQLTVVTRRPISKQKKRVCDYWPKLLFHLLISTTISWHCPFDTASEQLNEQLEVIYLLRKWRQSLLFVVQLILLLCKWLECKIFALTWMFSPKSGKRGVYCFLSNYPKQYAAHFDAVPATERRNKAALAPPPNYTILFMYM
jgi:hypothetical protein